MKREAGDRVLHPKEAKENLARLIITDLFDESSANVAHKAFSRIFVEGKDPKNLDTVSVGSTDADLAIPAFLHSHEMTESISQARRLIDQGGVYIDSERVDDVHFTLNTLAPGEYTIRVGKRRFLRVRIEK